MKRIIWCSLASLTLALIFFTSKSSFSHANESDAIPVQEKDKGTEQVLSFYRALIQEEPPTREQENAIFNATPAIRDHLNAKGYGTPGDPVLLH